MLSEAAGCLTSAVHVYLVSSSRSDYKAAAGSRLSDWAKSLPAFNLLLWYGLLWVITAVPNQLALTCIYKKTKQEGRKIIKSITLIPWLCKRLTCSYLILIAQFLSLPLCILSSWIVTIWRFDIDPLFPNTWMWCMKNPWIWCAFMSEPRPDICVSFSGTE